MRLAWHNIAHDRVRFLVTILGIACATLLMVLQGSILFGFLGAASKIIDSTDADIWIAGRGAPCFEFPVSIEQRIADIAHGVPGVGETSRVLTRIVEFRKPSGGQQLVTLIGAETGAGTKFPIPFVSPDSRAIQPHAALIDESSRPLLIDTPRTERTTQPGAARSQGNSGAGDPQERVPRAPGAVRSGQFPVPVELNAERADVVGQTTGFSSFLGTPYVFTSYADGLRYGEVRPAETMFVLVRLQTGAAIDEVKARLKERLPNVDVWTRQEFARKAQIYWTSQTGAGGAILAAALLGFLIGLAVVSQNVYATTMEHIEEFATLKAVGATHAFVMKVIVWQALACGIGGYLVGIALSQPVLRSARSVIPWLAEPPWLPLAILPLALAICVIASLLSVRAALAVEPARVFRA